MPAIFSSAHSYGTSAQNKWGMRQYLAATIFNVVRGSISVSRKIAGMSFVGGADASKWWMMSLYCFLRINTQNLLD